MLLKKEVNNIKGTNIWTFSGSKSHIEKEKMYPVNCTMVFGMAVTYKMVYDVMSDSQDLSYIKNYSKSIRENAIQIPWKYSKNCAHKKKSQWKPEMRNDRLTGYKSQLATRKQPQAPLVSHSAVSRAMATGVWQCEFWPSCWAMGTLYIVGWSINWYKDFGRHLSLPGKWECECPMTQQFHPSSHVSFIHSWRDEWGHGCNEPASAHVNED